MLLASTRKTMTLLMAWWLFVDWKGGLAGYNFIASWSTSPTVTRTGHWTGHPSTHRNWSQTPTLQHHQTPGPGPTWCSDLSITDFTGSQGAIMVLMTRCSAATLINLLEKGPTIHTWVIAVLRSDGLFYKCWFSKLMDLLQSNNHQLECVMKF